MSDSFDVFLEEVRAQSPVEFEFLVKDILEKSGLYRSVETDKSQHFDLVVYSDPFRPILVEIKNVRIIGANMIYSVDARKAKWISENKTKSNASALLVISGIASVAAEEAALDRGVEIWSLGDLYETKQSYKQEGPPVHIERTSRCHEILKRMNAIDTGAGKPALEYQKLSIQMFRCLFSPDLELIDEEVNDEDGRNRRDAIFDVRDLTGQWALIRDLYAAPYVVVDAKNNKNPISKRSVIDVSHYLKVHGCGLLGILLTREGGSGSARSAVKEHWIGQKKMIIILSHKELNLAADLKNDGFDPVEVIKNKIKELRISM